MLKVFFVEDDSEISGLILDLLSINGFEGYAVKNNADAWKAYHTKKPDVLFLKDKTVGFSGFEVLRMIREIDNDILIVIRGTFGVPGEVVASLIRGGANNYIGHACSAEELIAYLVALVRTADKEYEARSVFDLNKRVCLNIPAHMLYFQHQGVLLTSRECVLLGRLAMNKGKVVDREKLIREIWTENTPDTNTYLAKAIMRLRELLSPEPSIVIETIRARGYMLVNYDKSMYESE